jgi:hypothetical protein
VALLVILAYCCLVVFFVAGTVDAVSRDAAEWMSAGCRKRIWVWQAAGVVMPLFGVFYSGWYFLRIRPRLTAVQRELSAASWPNAVAGAGYVGSDHSHPTLGPHGEKVRIRLSLYTRFIPTLGLIPLSTTLFQSPGGHPYLVGLWGCVVISELLLIARFGIDLTPTDAVVYNLRRRRIAWRQIQAVTQERYAGCRRVVLWTDTADRIELRAPSLDIIPLGRGRFERDFHTIGRWWLQHRGPDWQPVRP